MLITQVLQSGLVLSIRIGLQILLRKTSNITITIRAIYLAMVEQAHILLIRHINLRSFRRDLEAVCLLTKKLTSLLLEIIKWEATMKRTVVEERKIFMNQHSLIPIPTLFNNPLIIIRVQEKICSQFRNMFQVFLSNNSFLRVPHNHLLKKMKMMTMTKSPNFPTIRQTIRFETFSITSTQERASQSLLITNLSKPFISSQYYIKALLGLNTLYNINHQLPSVGNQHQFSQLEEILPVMVQV